MASKRKVKQVYQKGYAKSKQQINEPRLKKILEIVRDQSFINAENILDIGCGDGFFTEELTKILNPKKVYGIDIADEAIKSLNSRKISGYCLDIDEVDLPFSSNYFDFIYCGNLIELVADADHLLHEIHRTLKKGGVAIVTFPNIASWLSRIALLCGYLPYYSRVSTQYDLGKMFGKITKGPSTGFIRLFTLKAFTSLCEKYNLHVVKTIGSGEGTLPPMLKPLDQLLSKKSSFAFQIICILTKT